MPTRGPSPASPGSASTSGINGVTLNDLGDADGAPGANDLQNFPIITSAISSVGSTTIHGTLNSLANTTFTVDFYANVACLGRPQGYREGQTYLGAADVTTDSSGNAVIDVGAPRPDRSRRRRDGHGDIARQQHLRVLPAHRAVVVAGRRQRRRRHVGLPHRVQLPSRRDGDVRRRPRARASSSPITTRSASRRRPSVRALSTTSPSPTPTARREPCRTAGSPTSSTCPGGQFYFYVTTLVRNAITAGVGGGNYGVGQDTLRQQMAVFLLKAKVRPLLRAAAVRRHLPRRALPFDLRELDRGSRRPGHHGRLRRRQLLSAEPGQPRPDGGLPSEGEVRIGLRRRRPARATSPTSPARRSSPTGSSSSPPRASPAAAAATTIARSTTTPADRWPSSLPRLFRSSSRNQRFGFPPRGSGARRGVARHSVFDTAAPGDRLSRVGRGYA